MNVNVHKKDYTAMSNHHLRNKNLSLKAKGLQSVMLSLPTNWDYSIDGLVYICKESHSCIKSILSELKEHGYLVIEKKMPNETESGRIEYEYHVFEVPSEKQEGKKQEVDFQGVEIQEVDFQEVEKPPVNQIYNKSITNKLNTNKSTTKEERKKANGYDAILADIPSEELRKALLEFIKMRKLVRSPLTDQALKINICKLFKLSSKVDEQIEIVNQSISNGWKSFYPLKNDDSKNNLVF